MLCNVHSMSEYKTNVHHFFFLLFSISNAISYDCVIKIRMCVIITYLIYTRFYFTSKAHIVWAYFIEKNYRILIGKMKKKTIQCLANWKKSIDAVVKSIEIRVLFNPWEVIFESSLKWRFYNENMIIKCYMGYSHFRKFILFLLFLSKKSYFQC